MGLIIKGISDEVHMSIKLTILGELKSFKGLNVTFYEYGINQCSVQVEFLLRIL